MEIVGTHPAVFVGVARHGGQASKGVTGYGKWKSVEAIENKGRLKARLNVGKQSELVNNNTPHPPVFL